MRLQRVTDLLFVALAFPVFLMVLPVFWIAGRCAGHRSLFFRQDRIGQDGKSIEILKFRTLESPGAEERCNRLFRVARSLGLDELPQTGLVLRGQMSCVGPRPLILRDLFPDDAPVDRRLWEAIQVRQSVPPGLTGVSQTLARSRARKGEAYWDMLNADTWYVQRATPMIDLLVMLVTPVYLLSAGRIRFPSRLIDSNGLKSITNLDGPEANFENGFAHHPRRHIHVVTEMTP